MRRRTLAGIQKVELVFGVVLPGLVYGPMMVLGLVSVVLHVLFQSPARPAAVMAFWLMALLCFVGIGALAALGFVILYGPDQINRKPLLRWLVIMAGILGIIAAGCLLWPMKEMVDPRLFQGVSRVTPETAHGFNGTTLLLIWLLILGANLILLCGPVVVALRYLPRLIRPTAPTSQGL